MANKQLRGLKTLMLSSGMARRFAAVIFKNHGDLADQSAAQAMALTAFFVRVLSAGIAFVSHILFARLIGQFEYGIYALVWVVCLILGNLSCIGFHTTQIRFLPLYHTRQDSDLYRGLTYASRLTALAVASGITTLGLATLHFFGSWVESHYLTPFALGFFIIPMIALGDMLDGTSRANGWPLSAMQYTYLLRPILIIAFMVGATLFGFDKSATTAMQAALLATFTTSLIQIFNVKRKLHNKVQSGNLRLEYRRWLRFALPMFVIDGIGFMLTNADVIIVGFYLPPDQVAIYFAAAKTIVLMQFVFFAVKAAAGPRFSQLIAKGESERLELAARQTARWSFWPSLLLGIVLIAIGPWLLLLFGEGFSQGHSLITILFIGFLAKSTIGPAETLLNMSGKQTICIWLYTITFVTNIMFNILLIPNYGLHGAAVAATLAMILETTLLYFATRSSLNIHLTPWPAKKHGMKDAGVRDGQ